MPTRARRPSSADVRGSPAGVGRASSRLAERVSDDLRLADDRFLRRRRRIGALSLGAIGSLGVVAAYQLGLLKHLPEPRLGPLDADAVDAAGEAYRILGTPDAALGILSQAVTLALAGAGTARRAQELPVVPVALAAKTVLDAAGGVWLVVEQASRHRRFCSWCLLATAAATASVPQALPEAAAAVRTLRGGRR